MAFKCCVFFKFFLLFFFYKTTPSAPCCSDPDGCEVDFQSRLHTEGLPGFSLL